MVDSELTKKQRLLVAREIRKETRRQREKPLRKRFSRRQVVAIGFSRARQIDSTIPEQEEDVKTKGIKSKFTVIK